MMRERILRLRSMEGTIVNVQLDDGSVIERCRLVSGGRRIVGTLWLVHNGEDVMIAVSEVTDVWPAQRLHVVAA
jgi:hypothetical protein